MASFCHLHVHSLFSMRRSIVRLDKLMDRLAELGQTAVAVTDRNGLYGVVPFIHLAEERGIHPVIGCELDVLADHGDPAQAYPLTLLAETRQGYSHLCRLITDLQLGKQGSVTREALLDHAGGLILLTGGADAEVPALVAGRQEGEAARVLRLYREAFAGRCYLELTDAHRRPYLLDRLIELGRCVGLPPVATREVHYLTEREAKLWQILQYAHAQGHPPERPRHLADEAEMRRIWYDLPEAILNTSAVAERCQVDLQLGVPRLPLFTMPEDELQRLLAETDEWERSA